MYISSDLKWEFHIRCLASKLREINYSLYHMKQFLRSEFFKQLYVSLFESAMRYGMIHYGGTYSTMLKPVVMCQRHALRIIYGLRRTDRMSYLFIDNNILSFNQLYKLNTMMYVYRHLLSYPIKRMYRETRAA